MKKVFLVDFENVHDDGLKKVSSTISRNDTVYIFYTSNAKKVEFASINKLLGDNMLKLVEAKPGKQSLDMTLATYLGSLVKKNSKNDTEYIIVSDDKDYTSVVSYWKNEGYKIRSKKLCRTISQVQPVVTVAKPNATKEQPKQKITTAKPNVVKEQPKQKKMTAEEKTELNNKISRQLSSETIDGIRIDSKTIGKVQKITIKCVSSNQGKNEVYNSLRKEFGDKKGRDIYGLIKKLI